jgi:hypothetical protein
MSKPPCRGCKEKLGQPYVRRHWTEDFDAQLAAIEGHRQRVNAECQKATDELLSRKREVTP